MYVYRVSDLAEFMTFNFENINNVINMFNGYMVCS